MFSHIATMLSFVYALCLTHVLASASELLLARDRVRFSGLHAIWMLNAAAITIVNWLSFWTMKALPSWSIGLIAALVLLAVVQFFICALVSLKSEPTGPVDMGAFFTRQKPMFVGGFLVLGVLSLGMNALDPSLQAPMAWGLPNWVAQNLTILPLIVVLVVALVSRARWVQWICALAMLAQIIAFGVSFVPVS